MQPTVQTEIEMERAHHLDEAATYQQFGTDVAANTRAVRDLLKKLMGEGLKVFGLGAPVKSSTLLNYAGIGPDLLPLITEVNPYKIGRLAPGTHIPIVDEKSVEDEPDFYLVLAWNYLDHFIDKKRKYLAEGGRLIVPVPAPKIISASDVESRYAEDI